MTILLWSIIIISSCVFLIVLYKVLKNDNDIILSKRDYFEKKIQSHLYSIDTINFHSAKYKIMVDATEIFPDSFELLKKAKKRVLFNMFLFGGKIADQTLDILKTLKENGVEIKFILQDPDNKINIAIPFKDILKKTGLKEDAEDKEYNGHEKKTIDMGFDVSYASTEVFPEKRLLNIDHGKLIVIDSEIAITGGMNFASTSEKNHDSSIIFTGDIVRECEKIFINKWMCSYKYDKNNKIIFNDPKELKPGEDKQIHKKETSDFDDCEVRPLLTSPYIRNTLDSLLNCFDNAKRSIYIAQLLITENNIIRRLARLAKEKELDIKIIVDPAKNLYEGIDLDGGPNNDIVALFQKMEKHHNKFNGSIRRYKTKPGQQLHLKLIVIDDDFCYMGSTNLMTAALYNNYEEYFLIKSEKLNSQYKKLFMEDWKNNSEEIEPLKLPEKAMALFADLFM